MSARLSNNTSILERRPGERKECASPACAIVFDVTPKRKFFCSAACQRHVARYRMRLAGAKASADKRRGSNPDTHIRVRTARGLEFLHRVIYEAYIGRELLPYPEEIVHHTDRDKHHNCVPGKIVCARLYCEGNLELLTGDAAAAHYRIHQAEIWAGRRFNREPLTQDDYDMMREYGG